MDILASLSPWKIAQLRAENKRLRAELDAACAKYADDLNKLWVAVGDTPDVDGGFVEAVCAEIRRLRDLEGGR